MRLRSMFFNKEDLQLRASSLHESLKNNSVNIPDTLIQLKKLHRSILEIDWQMLQVEPITLPPVENAEGVFMMAHNPRFELWKMFNAFFDNSNVDQTRLRELSEKGIGEARDLLRTLEFQQEAKMFIAKVRSCLRDLKNEMKAIIFEKEMRFYHKECKKFCCDVREYTPDEVKKYLTLNCDDNDEALLKAYVNTMASLVKDIKNNSKLDGAVKKVDAKPDAKGADVYDCVKVSELYERHYLKMNNIKFESLEEFQLQGAASAHATKMV